MGLFSKGDGGRSQKEAEKIIAKNGGKLTGKSGRGSRWDMKDAVEKEKK